MYFILPPFHYPFIRPAPPPSVSLRHPSSSSSLSHLVSPGLALTYILENCFKPESGSRVGVPKIGILITDGKSQDDVIPPAESLRNAGIELFAIGENQKHTQERRSYIAQRVNIKSRSAFMHLYGECFSKCYANNDISTHVPRC